MPKAFIRHGQPGLTSVLPHQGNRHYAVPRSGGGGPPGSAGNPARILWMGHSFVCFGGYEEADLNDPTGIEYISETDYWRDPGERNPGTPPPDYIPTTTGFQIGNGYWRAEAPFPDPFTEYPEYNPVSIPVYAPNRSGFRQTGPTQLVANGYRLDAGPHYVYARSGSTFLVQVDHLGNAVEDIGRNGTREPNLIICDCGVNDSNFIDTPWTPGDEYTFFDAVRSAFPDAHIAIIETTGTPSDYQGGTTWTASTRQRAASINAGKANWYLQDSNYGTNGKSSYIPMYVAYGGVTPDLALTGPDEWHPGEQGHLLYAQEIGRGAITEPGSVVYDFTIDETERSGHAESWETSGSFAEVRGFATGFQNAGFSFKDGPARGLTVESAFLVLAVKVETTPGQYFVGYNVQATGEPFSATNPPQGSTPLTRIATEGDEFQPGTIPGVYAVNVTDVIQAIIDDPNYSAGDYLNIGLQSSVGNTVVFFGSVPITGIPNDPPRLIIRAS